jgi:hypothetical protein
MTQLKALTFTSLPKLTSGDPIIQRRNKLIVRLQQQIAENAVIRALKQQEFNMVPTNSLEEAKVWLTDDMNNWRNIIREMKLEIPN